MPVAIATAAMPPYPTANDSAAATRRRLLSSRNGATVKNRSRMGSTLITTTIWYEKAVVNLYIHSIESRFDNFRSGPWGLSGNKRAIRRDSVVPLAVEFGAFDIDGSHLGVRDDDAAGVLASVEFAAHGEAGFGCGGRDQFDDDPVADERLGAPVLADEGEEPVFDFVPLTGAGRQVADHDVEAELVGQLLKFAFPQPHPRAVAAASVGGDE